MRITCNSVDEFIECLGSEDKVFQDTLRVSVVSRPKDGDRDSPVSIVLLQASAVVLVGEDSQYILEVGVECGKDYEDGEMEKNGTHIATRGKEKISKFAEKRKWKVLPGVISD